MSYPPRRCRRRVAEALKQIVEGVREAQKMEGGNCINAEAYVGSSGNVISGGTSALCHRENPARGKRGFQEYCPFGKLAGGKEVLPNSTHKQPRFPYRAPAETDRSHPVREYAALWQSHPYDLLSRQALLDRGGQANPSQNRDRHDRCDPFVGLERVRWGACALSAPPLQTRKAAANIKTIDRLRVIGVLSLGGIFNEPTAKGFGSSLRDCSARKRAVVGQGPQARRERGNAGEKPSPSPGH